MAKKNVLDFIQTSGKTFKTFSFRGHLKGQRNYDALKFVATEGDQSF